MEFRKTRELLQQCRVSAFRLELRDAYAAAGEQEPLQRFLAGQPFDLREWFQDWYDLVRELRAREVTVTRVRVVTEPLGDYQRWLLHLAALADEAGERIYYLPRHLAGATPTDDWWLLDDRLVAAPLFDPEGRSVGGSAVTTDPDIVAVCRGARDRLLAGATPYADYVA